MCNKSESCIYSKCVKKQTIPFVFCHYFSYSVESEVQRNYFKFAQEMSKTNINFIFHSALRIYTLQLPNNLYRTKQNQNQRKINFKLPLYVKALLAQQGVIIYILCRICSTIINVEKLNNLENLFNFSRYTFYTPSILYYASKEMSLQKLRFFFLPSHIFCNNNMTRISWEYEFTPKDVIGRKCTCEVLSFFDK